MIVFMLPALQYVNSPKLSIFSDSLEFQVMLSTRLRFWNVSRTSCENPGLLEADSIRFTLNAIVSLIYERITCRNGELSDVVDIPSRVDYCFLIDSLHYCFRYELICGDSREL